MSALNLGERLRLSAVFFVGAFSLCGLSLCCDVLQPRALAYAERLELKGETLRLTPQLFLSSSYDSNVFYEANPEPTGSVPNSGVMTMIGGALSLDNRYKQQVDFGLESSFAYRYYPYMDDENGRVSAKAQASRNTLDYLKAKTHLIFGAQSPLKLKLSDQLTYIERPAYENTLFGFQRLDNRLGVGGVFAPGGGVDGGPLSLTVGYQLQNVTFLNQKQTLQIQNRSEKLAHALILESRWRFLPKNYLLLDVSYTANNYNDFASNGQEVSSQTLSRDSTPLRVQMGLSGLLSARLAIFLKAGYANTYHKSGESFSGLIGLAEVTYTWEPRLRLSLGYQRDGRDSGFSNFYTLNSAFVKGQLKLSERSSFDVKLSYNIYEYSASNAIGDQGRTDPVSRAEVGYSFPLYQRFKGRLSWSLEQNATLYTLPVDQPAADFAQYSRQLVTLTLYFN